LQQLLITQPHSSESKRERGEGKKRGRGSEGLLPLELGMRGIYIFTPENIIECSKKFYEFPWDSIKFHSVPSCSIILYDLPQGSMVFYELLWSSMAFYYLCSFIWFYKVPLDPTDVQ
jgi:hypothetical protein